MSHPESHPLTNAPHRPEEEISTIQNHRESLASQSGHTERTSHPTRYLKQGHLTRRRLEINDLCDWKGNHGRHPINATTTIAFQNIHGLHTKHNPIETTIHELVCNMDQHSISILGISEHNLSLSNTIWRRRLHEGVQRTRPGRITQQFNSGPENDPAGHLMGGTGLIAIDDITGRVEHGGRGGDVMGRWSFMHLRRHRLPPLTIISVYQVCKQPTNVIGNTAWHQQRRFLDLQQRPEHPREAFLHDLEQFIVMLKRQNHAIILGGDWNDWMTSPSSSILKLCTTLQLVDPWPLQQPNDIDFATYEHGTHRIDSVLVSSDLHHMITNVRYSPVGLFGTTDHRAVLVEFDTNELFGTPIYTPPSQSSRSVFSKDRQSVTLFIEHMYNHMLHNNVFQRSQKLVENHPDDASLVERLDNLLGEAGKIGESKCKRRRPQWYSVPLVQCRQILSLLRHHLNGLRKRIDRSATVQQRLLNIGENIPMSMEIPVVKAQIRQYEDRLRKLVQNHESSRQTQLSASADAATAAGNDNKARAIRTISKSEQNLRTWKILQYMTSSANTPKLDRIEIPESWPEPINQPIETNIALEDPKTATSWRTVMDPSAIEYYLMLRNYQHFGQAHGTPFTVGILGDDIDWAASSDASEEILKGTYTQQNAVFGLCKSLLDNCRKSCDTDSIQVEVSELEFEGKITSWKERTTTSPSGRHLGWYKAMYAEGKYEHTSTEYATFLQKQQAIREVILRIMNYCINTGHPLQRWCNIVNMMIFKEPGVYKVHRLRVIHLFEADLNLLYAIKWRQLIRAVDTQNGIHPGQFGSRPGYEATTMALLEELRIDTSYLTRRTLLTFDNDASSCYDRIVINLASLVNRKNGMPAPLTRLHGTVLQQARYRIRTALGVSEIEYRNQPAKPLYGTGQGAGNSPGIWLLISNLLFEVYDSNSYGAIFVTADGTEIVRLGMSGFVDDTNAVTNMLQPQDEPAIDRLIQRMRHDAQLWSDLLHISGGKLELPKCSYQILKFEFKPNGDPVVSHQVYPPLSLQDPETGVIHEVPYLAPFQAHRILGHWKAPANRKQLKQLRDILTKVTRVSALILTSPISRSGAMLAYQGKYLAYLRYVLPQCWYTAAQLRRSERHSMAQILPKCGCARTMPHALVYAPLEFAGAGFVHWDTIQGEGQIKHFLKHWRTDSEVSKMLRVTVSWAQWQAGTSESVLQNVALPLPHLEGRWLPSMRTFLATIQGTIQLDCDYVPPGEREGDRYIMDLAMSFGDFSSEDLKIINYCRLYLHVTTVSELCDARGKMMLQDMFECRRPLWFNKTTITVLQERPSSYQIRYQWKRLCRKICMEDLNLGPWLTLGNWRVPTGSLRQRREAYSQHGPIPVIYVWHEGQYWETNPYGTSQVVLVHATRWLPNNSSTPIDVQRISFRRYLIFKSSHQQYVPPLEANETERKAMDFDDYIRQLPRWTQSFLQNIKWHQDPYHIMHFLSLQPSTEKLFVVSDGSCNDGTSMSYGVVIGTSTGIRLVESNGLATGQISSHRAECYGCLAGSLILHHLLRYTGISVPEDMEVQSFSDNQGMIRRLQQRQKYTIGYANTTLATDWDLIEEIHQVYQSIRCIRHEYEWVRGHQDKGFTTQLPPEAQYNIRADHLAGEYYIMGGTPTRTNAELLPHTKCILRLQGKEIHGHHGSHIRRAAARRSFRLYMQRRHGWDDATYDDIDWETFHSATRQFSGNAIQLMKLVHDKLPTNLVKSRYHNYSSAKCHYCPLPETFNHLCTSTCNARSIRFRNQIRQELADFLYAHTPRQFAITFLSALTIWLDGNTSTAEGSRLWEGPQHLRRAQQKIGWSRMFRGYLSKGWVDYLKRTTQLQRMRKWLYDNGQHTSHERLASQDVYNPYTDKAGRQPSTPTQTLSRIIQKLWEQMGILWQTHTTYIHASSSRSSPVHRQELQAQIRAMYLLKDKTMAAHREQYFHSDLDQYLDQATNLQMSRYINRYRPVILNSVRQATKLATNSRLITTFFPRKQPIPQCISTLHQAQEEPIHRKHTRRRTPMMQRITNYFTRPSHPSTPHTDDPP